MNGKELILAAMQQIQAHAKGFHDSGDIKELRGMMTEWNRLDQWRKSKAGRSFLMQHQPNPWLVNLERLIKKTRKQIRLEELGDVFDTIQSLLIWKRAELKMEGLSLSVIGLLDETPEKVAEVTGCINLPRVFTQSKMEAGEAEAEFKRLQKVIPPASQNQWTKEEKARVSQLAKPPEKVLELEAIKELAAWKSSLINEMARLCKDFGVSVEKPGE